MLDLWLIVKVNHPSFPVLSGWLSLLLSTAYWVGVTAVLTLVVSHLS